MIYLGNQAVGNTLASSVDEKTVVITVTYDEETEQYSSDKNVKDVYDAVTEGAFVVLLYSNPGVKAYFFLHEFDYNEENGGYAEFIRQNAYPPTTGNPYDRFTINQDGEGEVFVDHDEIVWVTKPYTIPIVNRKLSSKWSQINSLYNGYDYGYRIKIDNSDVVYVAQISTGDYRVYTGKNIIDGTYWQATATTQQPVLITP